MNKRSWMKEYLLITISVGICAFALYFFMIPGGVILGGVSGLCVVLASFLPLKISAMTLVINLILLTAGILLVVVGSGILIYDTKALIVGILGTYANGLVIDYFISGFIRKRRVCILSDQYEEICTFILNDINRGATLYAAKGGYGGKGRTEVVTILDKGEYARLMNYIVETDKHAFVTVSTVSEVIGSWYHE